MTSFDVVIAAAHAEDTLQAAVLSALSPPVHRVFVVVDAGEETLETAQLLAQEHEGVRILRSYGAGVGAARNIGLRACTADWVLFLDADDEYSPGYAQALADLIDSADCRLAMVHTRILRVCEGVEQDNHPLRFRFAAGNRLVHLESEPHMIGLSVAAAAFDRRLLTDTGILFNTDISWSEDADFIVRYLLAASVRLPQLTVGFSSDAIYRYRVGKQTTSVAAWSHRNKYILPFTNLYLRWVDLAHRVTGSNRLPVWLQNSLIYELCWYVEADRQVTHPAQQIDRCTRQRCAQLIGQVLAAVERQTVENYALTPLSLDRRMLLAAAAAGAEKLPLNGQVVSYRQEVRGRLRKHTYFYRGVLPREEFYSAEKVIGPFNQKWVSHTLFDTEFVRERILWFRVEQAAPLTVWLNGEPVTVAPYRGLPQLPGAPSQAGGIPAGPKQPDPATGRALAKQLGRCVYRCRRALWHLRHSRHRADETATGPQGRQAPASSGHSGTHQKIWLYMDRAHRAADNAEAFYRYAAAQHPEVEHVFALSRRSSDWQRLEDEGFHLVNTDSRQIFREVLGAAQHLLVSDVSDPVLAPLLGCLSNDQRLIFLQHGITRKQVWRWLNPRRIDVMITSTDDETAGIVADGTHYTLSGVEVWQTGMPRLDSLRELKDSQAAQDLLLIAPTWVPALRQSPEPQRVRAWVETWTAWIPAELLAADSPVKPVFFVHPNMEDAVLAADIHWRVQPVQGAELPGVLARAAATVTDSSSIADEGHFIGVPGFMVRQHPDTLQVEEGHSLEGFIFVDTVEQLGQRTMEMLAEGSLPTAPSQQDSGPACKELLSRLMADTD